MNSAAGHSGFSLVEVLCAILILGVALAGLTQGLTVALQSGKESELQATAALFAAGQIETLRAAGGLLDGEQEGDCGEGLPLYRWKQSIRGADIAGLHEVAVVVENAKTGKPIYELRTLLFEPADAPTAGTSDAQRKSEARERRSR
jgi:prepilin-type N-terminal cleavage/methylation domain-containing protein